MLVGEADAAEDLWRTYFASIFNPARLNPTMMRSEMPQKYWKLLPEAALLPDLMREAGARGTVAWSACSVRSISAAAG